MSTYYILEDGLPVAEPDLMKWALWFQEHDAERVVAQTNIAHGITVSTVFLGLDHSFFGDGPILYETMIFGGALDQHQWRYRSREDAEAGHADSVKLATDALG